MITKLRVENFKRLDFEINLDEIVTFVGPNNSGKTSALQAIALWYLGISKWIEKKQSKQSHAKERTGVAINRKDLINIPVPSTKLLWKNLQVQKKKDKSNGQDKVFIKIYCELQRNFRIWKVGLDFYYANDESIYVRLSEDTSLSIEDLDELSKIRIGFLPPMSGLATDEDKLETGSIQVRIGEGRTAEVLRNLCYKVFEKDEKDWKRIVDLMKKLFGIELNNPEYIATTGKLKLTYTEGGIKYDISNIGKGFQQILLILSYISAEENTILLIDEPDAHLESIRQREIYNLLSDLVRQKKGQLIIATHSEVVVNEAADKDLIIAFLVKPHIVNNKSHLVKSLSSIGFDQYLLAEQKKWILYLEGSSDLSILKAFAKKLKHPVLNYLENAFIKYVTNRPMDAREHFYAIQREAIPELKGIALYDRIDFSLSTEGNLIEMMWNKYEIENYIPIPEALLNYFKTIVGDDLFNQDKISLLEKIIQKLIPPIALESREDQFWIETKISSLLERIFEEFRKETGIKLLNKGEFYELIDFVNEDLIDQEVIEKLDKINEVASSVS
jgi:AAA15 family ATPase/GTPase